MKILVKKRDRWWKVFCQECSVEWRFNAWRPSFYARKPYSDTGAYAAILAHLKRHKRVRDRAALKGKIRLVSP